MLNGSNDAQCMLVKHKIATVVICYVSYPVCLRVFPTLVQAADSQGNSALQIAACNGRVKVLNFLVEQGVDLHTTNKLGMTPLHTAAKCGQVSVGLGSKKKRSSCGRLFHVSRQLMKPPNMRNNDRSVAYDRC